MTRRVGHEQLELAKWVGIASMTVDHFGKIVAPEHHEITHLVGRLAFPLLAWIVGARLALDPGLAPRYLRHLVPWALLSQPVYVVVGHDWSQGNVLATLALGVVVTASLERLAGGSGGRLVAGAGLALSAGLSPFVEFGPLGVAAVPATAWLAGRNLRTSAWASGVLGLAANLRATVPPLGWLDAPALLASVVALASPSLRLPRPWKTFFYVYYPAHLYALHLWDLFG